MTDDQTPDNVTALPEKVHLNLDTLERERTYTTFTPVVNGRAIHMTDPFELDWRDLMSIEDPSQFLRYAISEEDRSWLREQAIPGWKFAKLVEGYVRHYGLDQQQGKLGGVL